MLASAHLITWNVAGWKTTHKEITRTYPYPPKETTTKRPRTTTNAASPQILTWLQHLKVDILFLQETKLKTTDLANDIYLAKFPNWETYWSCNDGSGKQRSGLNGVATFAPKEGPLKVIHANNAPLNDPELDREGRCIMTDHGVFSAFNVYAPNMSGGKRLGYRLRYLSALRQAMCEQRIKTGRPVILVGDLNLKARSLLDRQWTRSQFDINRLVALGERPRPAPWSLDAATLCNLHVAAPGDGPGRLPIIQVEQPKTEEDEEEQSNSSTSGNSNSNNNSNYSNYNTS